MERHYKVAWATRGRRNLPTERHESEPMSLATADNLARELVKTSRAVTILRQSQGLDHPANRGQWFLYRVWK